jgi:hypothetical protein
MDSDQLKLIQEKVNKIGILYIESLHTFPTVPSDFRPWVVKLSPSALYNCSLPLRKKLHLKTPEVKLMSIKRWVTTSMLGIDLPDGVFFSIKRREDFVTEPTPHLKKTEYTLVMLPYGNVWSQINNDTPITEEWLFSDASSGKLILEELMIKDALNPVVGYFESCYKYMLDNPEQIGIHLKRKKNLDQEIKKTKIEIIP